MVKVKNRPKKKMNWGLGLLALPGVLFLLAFSYAPLFGLIIPFKNIDYAKGIFNSDWAGFDNFKFFFSSQDAWRITRNTVLLNFMFIAVTLFLAVVFSLALFELGRRQVKLYQTCTFVPYFVSWVVASYILYAFLSPDMGVIPNMLESMGMDIPNFYNSPEYWPGILLFSYVWKNIGYMMLLFYATLMGIDTTQFEAAAIDGANKFQTLYKIIIPMTMPSVTICLFLTLTNCFKLFDQNLALTAGGPAKKTAMLAYDIYTTFYNRNGWEGVGQAKAVIFFIIVAAISLTQLYFTRRKEVEN